jgi:hypothetical protein
MKSAKITIAASAFLAGTALAVSAQADPVPFLMKVWAVDKPIDHVKNCTIVGLTVPEVTGDNSGTVPPTKYYFAVKPAGNSPGFYTDNEFNKFIWGLEIAQVVSKSNPVWLYATGGETVCAGVHYPEILPMIEPNAP